MSKEVKRGSWAYIAVKGVPNTQYYISAEYYDGSDAKTYGLDPKNSDRNGLVAWEWKVDNKAEVGPCRVSVISLENDTNSLDLEFEVT